MAYISATALALLASLFVLSNAGFVNFTDCGHGNLRSIEIQECRLNPCVLKRGTTINMRSVSDARFTANTISSKITVNWSGFDVPVPNYDNICAGMIQPPCPVVARRMYTTQSTMRIASFAPLGTMAVTYKALNEYGQLLACAKLNVRIVDKNAKRMRIPRS